jgi:hypothetical protein
MLLPQLQMDRIFINLFFKVRGAGRLDSDGTWAVWMHQQHVIHSVDTEG